MSATPRSFPGRLPGLFINFSAVIVLSLAVLFLVPGLAGYDRYVITGGSMSGTFERGSLVFEKEIPVSSLQVGDIITYMPPADSGINELVTHRIESIEASENGPLFRTKGDANASSDPWVFHLQAPTQNRLQAAVPFAGWVFIALADRDLRMLIIGLPAGVVAVLSLVELVRAMRQPKASTVSGSAGGLPSAVGAGSPAASAG